MGNYVAGIIANSFLLSFLQGYLLAVCIFLILSAIGWIGIFIRVGIPWWKALIPVYNTYLAFKITGSQWLIVLVVPIVAGYLFGIPSVADICSIFLFIALIFYYMNLSSHFNHHLGMTFLLIFLHPFAALILGYEKRQDKTQQINIGLENNSVSEEKEKSNDEIIWLCSICNTNNSMNDFSCKKCGTPRNNEGFE